MRRKPQFDHFSSLFRLFVTSSSTFPFRDGITILIHLNTHCNIASVTDAEECDVELCRTCIRHPAMSKGPHLVRQASLTAVVVQTASVREFSVTLIISSSFMFNIKCPMDYHTSRGFRWIFKS